MNYCSGVNYRLYMARRALWFAFLHLLLCSSQTLFTSPKCALSRAVSSALIVFCHPLSISLPTPHHDFIWPTPTYFLSHNLSFLRQHWRLNCQIWSIQHSSETWESLSPSTKLSKSVLLILGCILEHVKFSEVFGGYAQREPFQLRNSSFI